MKPYKLNTSNPGKLKEFQRFFKEKGLKLDVSEIELNEVDADPITVVVHKASQMDGILVEDTSLEIEGADVGVNVKWLIDDLKRLLGKKAIWTVLLAQCIQEEVHVYKGEVIGKIVFPRMEGSGFGFDPYFLPDGSERTLSEEKPNHFNARAQAVEHFVAGKTFLIRSPIYKWDGAWQEGSI